MEMTLLQVFTAPLQNTHIYLYLFAWEALMNKISFPINSVHFFPDKTVTQNTIKQKLYWALQAGRPAPFWMGLSRSARNHPPASDTSHRKRPFWKIKAQETSHPVAGFSMAGRLRQQVRFRRSGVQPQLYCTRVAKSLPLGFPSLLVLALSRLFRLNFFLEKGQTLTMCLYSPWSNDGLVSTEGLYALP